MNISYWDIVLRTLHRSTRAILTTILQADIIICLILQETSEAQRGWETWAKLQSSWAVELGLQSQKLVSRARALTHTASQESGTGNRNNKTQNWAIRAKRKVRGIQNHPSPSLMLQMSVKSFAEGLRRGGREDCRASPLFKEIQLSFP